MNHDANIDYCGVVCLLRQMVLNQLCTKSEAEKIAARIAVRYGADIILSL